MNFKEQLTSDIIPFVERMIDKETKHLSFLQDNKSPKEFIDNSKKSLSHLQQRLQEYIEYANKL